MQECVCLQCGRLGFDPWVGKIPWRKKWQPTPVFLPGEFHGLRSLVGYSPEGRKESDTTERLHFAFHFKMVAKAFNNSFKVIYLDRDRERLRPPESYWKVFFLGNFLLIKKKKAYHYYQQFISFFENTLFLGHMACGILAP